MAVLGACLYAISAAGCIIQKCCCIAVKLYAALACCSCLYCLCLGLRSSPGRSVHELEHWNKAHPVADPLSSGAQRLARKSAAGDVCGRTRPLAMGICAAFFEAQGLLPWWHDVNVAQWQQPSRGGCETQLVLDGTTLASQPPWAWRMPRCGDLGDTVWQFGLINDYHDILMSVKLATYGWPMVYFWISLLWQYLPC